MKNNKIFAKVTFFLKEPKSDKETLIYAFLHFNSQQLKLSTGKKIHPKHWDSEKQRAKRNVMSEFDINQRLSYFQNQLNLIYNKLLSDGITPTKEIIKNAFLSNEFYLNKKKNFFDVFDLFIENYTNHGIRPGDSTIYKYGLLKKRLMEFTSNMKHDISLEDIKVNFANDFVSFLLQRERGITNNTVGTYMKNLKLFMKWSSDQEYHSNFEYRKFQVFIKDTFQVSLDDEEIKLIQQLDLSNKPKLENSRDMFLLQCNLGLRYSDLTRLNNSHINLDEEFIEIVSQKTHSFQIIPLSELAISIIKKYKNENFPFVTLQIQNEHIKQICKLAGINKIVNDYKEIGNYGISCYIIQKYYEKNCKQC